MIINHTEIVFKATMRHRAVSAVLLFSIWYVLENKLHYQVAAKGVEIAIFPYADALLKQLGGLVE